jgi:hypothetical protein
VIMTSHSSPCASSMSLAERPAPAATVVSSDRRRETAS